MNDQVDIEKLAREALEQHARIVPAPWEWWNVNGPTRISAEDGFHEPLRFGAEELVHFDGWEPGPNGGPIGQREVVCWTPEDDGADEEHGPTSCGGIRVDAESAQWITDAREREPLLAAEVLRLRAILAERIASEAARVMQPDTGVGG